VRAFCDLSGHEVGLGRCLGQGGEGAVYSVTTAAGTAAKVYARRPDALNARKLGAMVQLVTEELAAAAAWPTDLLLDPDTGEPAGFLMPRVDGHREIHKLYGPTDRRAAFPDASWAFLLRAARNVAAAFEAVHRHGHVVGDVNQANVVVSRQAMARLIDCDSFQIRHLGRTYPCRVGVPLFTPPELHGKRLDEVERSTHHDGFGLAVVVFQLLFMGRHPFAGRHPGRAITADAAIREGIFAFGPGAAASGWEPPPFSLRLRDVSPPVARLFRRAFSPEAAAGDPRPSAAEWVAELDALEARLLTCGEDPRHVYAPVDGCPWCRIEHEGGPSFFYLPQGAASDAFDLAATWHAIEAVRSPGKAAPPGPPAAESAVASGQRPGLSTLVMRALRGLVEPLRPATESMAAREAADPARAQALETVRRLQEQWNAVCGDEAFERLRDELARARVELEGLQALEDSERRALADRFHETALPHHLRTFALEFARIPGLGPAELARLAARGITTAADISPERLMSIHGIDLSLVRGLLVFRRVATRAFDFDPDIGVPGRDRR
jgi:DNA-binding helix-hairpin-helix protein with protein kinase domain